MSDNETISSTYSKLKQSEAIRLAKETTDVNVIIELSKHENPHVRKASLREMCPCRVREDIDLFWKRVIKMITDEDPVVRAQVS
jgi:vesicle coat complex subunit